MKIMLAVWCFMVFAAVGERLAVSGKRERERESENKGERVGVWMESGSTLFVSRCIHSFVFLLAPALFQPWSRLGFYCSGVSVPSSPVALRALSDAVDLLHQHISIAALLPVQHTHNHLWLGFIQETLRKAHCISWIFSILQLK